MYGRPDKCARCGVEYTDRWPRCDKKYCSNKCRQAAYRERKFQEMISARDQLRAKADADRKAKAKRAKARKAKRNPRRVT